ncbi:MAG: DUF2568 domain-containing protein [Actinomycetota bacterium]
MDPERFADPRDVVLNLFTVTGLVGVALGGLALGSTPSLGVAWAMAGVGVMGFLWSRYLRVRALVPLHGGARLAAVTLWFSTAFLAWWYAGHAVIGLVLVVPVSLELTRPARR